MPRNGSATSSKPVTLRPATLTSGASLTCEPTTSEATPNAISSPASADGHMPSLLPDGPMTDLFGQEVAPVSHSQARLEAGKLGGKTMDGISGLIGSASSLNARLTRSLVSRLPKPEIGSMKSAMTWKRWVTPSGRQFCRLAVSVSTMRALGFTLLATPTATANQAAPSMMKHRGCRGIVVSPETWRDRMGYEPAWLFLAPSEMPSPQSSPPSSSPPR